MINQFKRVFFTYLILLVLFSTLLVLCSLVPLQIKSGVFARTVQTFLHEGTYPSFGLPWRKIVLDNYTEAIMINTAFFTNHEKPIESALTNKRHANKQNSTDQIAALESLSKNIPGKEYGYERYWHGYLVYLRPLSTILPYQAIRIVLSFFIYGLFAFFIYKLFKKFGLKTTLVFTIGFFVIDFFYIGASMQFSNVFIVALTTSIYSLTKKTESQKNNYLLFFITGALTSFFDLLTVPLVTLSLLLAINNLRHNLSLKDIFKNSFFWSIGYLGLWSAKWTLSSIYFAPQALFTALDQIATRTVNKADDKYIQFEAIKLNVFQLIGYSRESKIFFLYIFVFMILLFLRYRKLSMPNINKILPWFIIGLMPYAWYLIAANHSYLHVWFTYRAQLASIISLLFIYIEFLDTHKIKTDLVSIKKFFLRFSPTS